jgi:hypothetical protein
MKNGNVVCASLLALCFVAGARAQDAPQASAPGSEARVPLSEQAVAYDADGQPAIGARLRTTQLTGTPDSPERNSRIVVENRSPSFYTYASGWATFYGADNVRCGEGLWKLEALAPGEQAEVDTPGLRLTCTPTSWRVSASNLLARAAEAGRADVQTAPQPAEDRAPSAGGSACATAAPTQLPPLELNVNGKTIPIQPGNPLEVVVGKERVRIVLQPAP